MRVEDSKLVKDFSKMTSDAWEKGWHERNGGNITYRIPECYLEEIKDNFCDKGEWKEIGINVKNLSTEFFLVTGSGKYIRNISIEPNENIGRDTSNPFLSISKLGSNHARNESMLVKIKTT